MLLSQSGQSDRVVILGVGTSTVFNEMNVICHRLFGQSSQPSRFWLHNWTVFVNQFVQCADV
jgi:hypothetical protein